MRGKVKIASIYAVVTLAAMLATTPSCTKNEKVDLSHNLNVANDVVIAQRPFHTAFRMLMRAVNDTSLQQTHQDFYDGASVTYNPGQNRYTFYFMGSYGPDSVIRSGRIEADLSGDLHVQGTWVRFSFNNYFEDAMPVTAGDSLVNTGISGNNVGFSNTVTGGTIVKDTIGTILFNADFEYLVPVDPPGGIAQTLVSISGTLGGTSSKGYFFHSVVSEPLVYPVYSEVCAWVRQGTFRFSLSDTVSVSGTIRFPGLTSCNDSVYYDFGVTTYKWRMKPNYLRH